MEPTQETELTPESSLRISLLRNVRYHEDREGFFRLAGRSCDFATVLSGTSAVAALAIKPWLGAGLALLPTIAGAIQLVFGLARAEFEHAALRKEFIALNAALRPNNVEATRAEAEKLYAEEAPTYHACDALAFNAAQKAMGRPARYAKFVSRAHRRWRHIRRYIDVDFLEVGDTSPPDPTTLQRVRTWWSGCITT